MAVTPLTLADAKAEFLLLVNQKSSQGQWSESNAETFIRRAGEQVYHDLIGAFRHNITAHVYVPYRAGCEQVVLRPSSFYDGFYTVTSLYDGPSFLAVQAVWQTNKPTVPAGLDWNRKTRLNFTGPVTGGTITVIVDGNTISQAFTVDSDTTLAALATQIGALATVSNASASDEDGDGVNDRIVITPTSTTNTVSVSAQPSGGQVSVATGVSVGSTPSLNSLTWNQLHHTEKPFHVELLHPRHEPQDLYMNRDEADVSTSPPRYMMVGDGAIRLVPTPTSDTWLRIAYLPHYSPPSASTDPVMAAAVWWPWCLVDEYDTQSQAAAEGRLRVFPGADGLIPIRAAAMALAPLADEARALITQYVDMLTSFKAAVANYHNVHEAPTGRAYRR